MTWADAAQILFGAGLGVLISVGQAWFSCERERKRAEKLLLIELPTIQEAVKALAGKKIIPMTELPALSYFGVNDFVSLSDSVAPHVYELDNALKRAEASRRIATGYLNNQDSSEFLVHSTVYAGYIDSALKAVAELQKKLHC